jgi:O-antigen ligase
MIWVVLGLIILFAGWSLVNPYVGLIGLLGINIIQPGELFPALDALHVERVMAILVLVSLLIHHGRFVFSKPTKALLLFWLATFLSVPFAFWRMGALLTAIDFSRVIIYHILIANLVNSQRRFRIFLIVFTVLIGWLAVSSYVAYLRGNFYNENGHFAREEGLTSSGGNPNELGLTLVSGLPLIALLWTRGKWRDRMLGFGVAGICIWAVIFTGSRSSFLSLLFLLAAYVFSTRRRIIFLPFALGLLALLWQVMPTEYQHRYLSVESLKGDESYQLRVVAWHAGWHMFLDYPLTGVGIGQFQFANGAKYWPLPGPKVWMNAHSLYVVLIAELGIIGTITFVAYLWTLFALNRSLRKAFVGDGDVPPWLRLYPTACNFSLLILLFVGYSSHDLYRSTWYMLGALTGCAQMLLEKNRIEVGQTQLSPIRVKRLMVPSFPGSNPR